MMENKEQDLKEILNELLAHHREQFESHRAELQYHQDKCDFHQRRITYISTCLDDMPHQLNPPEVIPDSK